MNEVWSQGYPRDKSESPHLYEACCFDWGAVGLSAVGQNMFFGKVYYGQVVVQHVFQCEASKHRVVGDWQEAESAVVPCGGRWGVEGADSGHKMLHIGPRLNRNSYLRTPPLYPHHLHIITSEITSNNEWRCRLADSSHSEFITCLFYYALLTKPPPVHHQLSIIILQMWSSSSLLSILSWASVQGL